MRASRFGANKLHTTGRKDVKTRHGEKAATCKRVASLSCLWEKVLEEERGLIIIPSNTW